MAPKTTEQVIPSLLRRLSGALPAPHDWRERAFYLLQRNGPNDDMAFICDSTTRAELNAAANKQAWGAVLNAALGNVRRIRCKRDANAAAADPFATGVEFRNVGSTGTLKIVGGKVVGFGRLKGSTIKLAADISTGKSALRVEGNGRYFEVTLGTAGSGADVIANGSFTANNGLALKPDFAISGPKFLPSGTGPAAPELDIDAPVAFRVMDYTNPAAPVVAGTAQMNVRDLDMVMDNAQIASEMGDVRMQRCADGAGVVLGTGGDAFRIAATVLSMNKVCNQDDPTKPVHQVLWHSAPHGRWPSYPFSKDLNRLTDTTILPPHKIELLRGNGTVLAIIEMYSTRTNDVPGTGLAMNDPAQYTATSPVRPWITCFQMPKWQSHKIKRNTKALHYLPGVEAGALAPTNVIAFDAAPQCWPPITGRYLSNSLGNWRVSPKWSRPGGINNTGLDTTIVDTFVLQIARDNYINQLIGWGYEPGATGQHTWYMSPGGSRHDRAAWPHVMAAWASDPTANRIHGAVPLETLKDAWLDNYFNEGCHYHPSATLERGISIPKEKVLAGAVCYSGTYYAGGNEDFVPDTLNNNIALLAAQNAQDSGPLDKNGRRFNNEYQRDDQHSYSNGALGVYINNSPAHVISARHTFNSHVLCGFNMTQGVFGRDNWLRREHAWHMWQHANMWMATSSDDRSITRNELEAMWERHLHAAHTAVMPSVLTGTDAFSRGVRGIGVGVVANVSPTHHTWVDDGADTKAFYMAQVLLLMKQSGSWEAMRSRSVKCREILDLIVTSLAKYSVDMFMDVDGRYDLFPTHSPPRITPIGTPLPDPAWSNMAPPNGQANWIREPDGSLIGRPGVYQEKIFNTQHFRAQYVWILRDYFPEFNYPRVTEAAAKVDGYYADVAAAVARDPATAPFNPVESQFHYRFAMMGKFKKALTIGAPA